jgi:translation initiation factor 3 subunit D
VSRVHPKDSYNHVLLTVQGYKPKEFAAQINLSVNNMWGILKVHAATHFLISTS